MIGTSTAEYYFIRICILGLRLIAPLSILYVTACWYYGAWIYSAWLGWYALLEALFYLFVYVPRSWLLQKEAEHPPLLTRGEREALFAKCLARVRDTDLASGWFYSSPASEIKRDNLLEWIAWALFSTHKDGLAEEWAEEIEGYVTKMEKLMGHKLETGWNETTQCMRVSLDPVVALHRPLIWYFIVGWVDIFTSAQMKLFGFEHFTQRDWWSCFPIRFLSVLSPPSPHPQLSYWYRPHRSKTKHPVLFLHGIGIGLWPYTPFLREFIAAHPDVGIIAVEHFHISMRISPPPPKREIMLGAITDILDFHDLPQVVVAGHSYGTITAAHMLGDPTLSKRVAASLLVDPIPFLLHLPAVAFNFVYRQPQTASQWQLWYFASRDPDVARTLARHFFWAENILWKEDLKGMKVGVVLSEEDQIVDALEVWRYLTGEEEPTFRWEKDTLEVLYYCGLDHSNVFDRQSVRRPMVEMLSQFVLR